MSNLSPVSDKVLEKLLQKARVSQHRETIIEFYQSGDKVAKVSPSKPGGKLAGLQSGLQNARKRLKVGGDTWADNVQITLSKDPEGVYLIRRDMVGAVADDAQVGHAAA